MSNILRDFIFSTSQCQTILSVSKSFPEGKQEWIGLSVFIDYIKRGARLNKENVLPLGYTREKKHSINFLVHQNRKLGNVNCRVVDESHNP